MSFVIQIDYICIRRKTVTVLKDCSAAFSGLESDLGTVFKPLADSLGIYKDPRSYQMFSIAQNSIIMNSTIGQRMAEVLGVECGHVVQSYTFEMQSLMSPESMQGVGVVLEQMER